MGHRNTISSVTRGGGLSVYSDVFLRPVVSGKVMVNLSDSTQTSGLQPLLATIGGTL